MTAAQAFTAAIRSVSSELGMRPHSRAELNQAAARIDRAGRRLHGLDWLRDREIGGCLSAAVSELHTAPGLAEGVRAEAVRRAVGHLDAALGYADEGMRPPEAAPSAERPTGEVSRGD